MTSLLNLLLKQLDYHFSDQELLTQALRHRSAGKENNERLEFLGDAILNFVIAEALYLKFPQAKEGQLSRLRSTLVNKESLAAIARQLKLSDYLILGCGEYKTGGAYRDSILADTMEAIFGAIYLDGGSETGERCIISLYQDRLQDLSLAQNHKDPKTVLQEYLQFKHHNLPIYHLDQVTGKEHDQTFIVSCHCSLLSSPVIGEGSSRRKAEQDAAQRVLLELKHDAA